MEHEDNAQFDNYLQSAQQNLQHGNNTANNNMCAGDALVGLNVDGNVGCGGAMGSGVGLGSKYDDLAGENFAEDEREFKYITEVNKSEKEQAGTKQALHVGNGNSQVPHAADYEDVDDAEDDVDDYDTDGMPSMQYRNNNLEAASENGNEEQLNGAVKENFDLIQTDVGDFSQTSNTASTAEGGCIDMLQVEMKIEPLQQHQLQQQQQHLFDEEDPSSNGTSSLSENPPIPQQLTATFDFLAINDDFLQNKENADPKSPPESPIERPTDLNFELHASQLNPDAKEFVPSFGSNATSPTKSETADSAPVMSSVFGAVGEPVEQLQQQLSAISRHLLLSGDDDVVARSPRKGREIDMESDNVVLPPSDYDFGNEANKRPHELEQEPDLIGDNLTNNVPTNLAFGGIEFNIEQKSPLPKDEPENEFVHSLSNLIESDTEEQIHVEPSHQDDMMKQSIYMTENGDLDDAESIENVLNSVQPLPTDIESLNTSFAADIYSGTPEEARAMEELLDNQIDDEDEHISHPPSIEEMQMNLQNSNNKDLLHENMNLDMNSAAHMQESFYMEQQQHNDEPVNKIEIHDEDGFYAQQFAANESLLMDTTVPFDAEQNASIMNEDVTINSEVELLNNDFTADVKVMDYDEQNIYTNLSSPSPKSTVEEKHLMEETKEQLVAKTIEEGQQFVEELGKKMEHLLSSSIDTDLKQVCFICNFCPFTLAAENLSVLLNCFQVFLTFSYI